MTRDYEYRERNGKLQNNIKVYQVVKGMLWHRKVPRTKLSNNLEYRF
jgi:hypothetical protein